MSVLKLPIKIALVDDDEMIARLYKKFLGDLPDTELFTFTDAREALDTMIKEGDFAIAIIDINMPHLPGEQLVEKIFEGKLGTDVIVATGSASAAKTLPCVMAGARDIIPKPVKKQVLVEAVQRSIDRVERLRTFYMDLGKQMGGL